jgi:hypothetical protein
MNPQIPKPCWPGALSYDRFYEMTAAENRYAPILTRGVGNVGSAGAPLLFHTGYALAINDKPAPAAPRRGMAGTAAGSDGTAVLDGILARPVKRASRLKTASGSDLVPEGLFLGLRREQ